MGTQGGPRASFENEVARGDWHVMLVDAALSIAKALASVWSTLVRKRTLKEVNWSLFTPEAQKETER